MDFSLKKLFSGKSLGFLFLVLGWWSILFRFAEPAAALVMGVLTLGPIIAVMGSIYGKAESPEQPTPKSVEQEPEIVRPQPKRVIVPTLPYAPKELSKPEPEVVKPIKPIENVVEPTKPLDAGAAQEVLNKELNTDFTTPVAPYVPATENNWDNWAGKEEYLANTKALSVRIDKSLHEKLMGYLRYSRTGKTRKGALLQLMNILLNAVVLGVEEGHIIVRDGQLKFPNGISFGKKELVKPNSTAEGEVK